MTETAVAARPASPFRGLAPFEDSELDELLFFGRERERAVIAANLHASRLTVLYGPSGVGKSSVLAAGVARDLRALPERPLVVVHSAWAGDPAAGIAAAVAAEAGTETGPLGEVVEVATALRGDLFLLLDQVDEYFVYRGGDPALGDVLAELVGRAELPVHVLVSIREDALARLDAFKTRVPGLLANRLRLDHLTRAAGRQAITGPVERFADLAPDAERRSVEPELVEAVLDGVRAGAVVQPGRGRGTSGDAATGSRVEAPYLQLVMQRLWETEQARGSAVLRLATLAELGGPQRIVEEHLERALGDLTARQKTLAARMFNQLVTPSGTKIAHGDADLARYASAPEAEVEPVLATLTRERILRPVGDEGAQAHEIYHDVLADAVLSWRVRFEGELALAEARRRHRRVLAVAAAALVALAFTAALALFALSQRSDARHAATRARARELDAVALGLVPTDPQRGLADALRAARLAPGRQAEDVLRALLLAARLRGVLPAGGPVASASFSPGGRLILTASADGKARLYDRATRRLLHTLDAGSPLAGAVFDPHGRLVVTEGKDGVARVWDVATGRRVAALHHRGAVLSAAFSQGAGLLVTTSADRTARIWRAGSWRPVAVLDHPGAVRSAAFNPDGSHVVTRTGDRFARMFSTRTGRLVRRFDNAGSVGAALFTPNGKRVVTAGAGNAARIWDAGSGRLLHVLHREPDGTITAAAVSPNGAYLATASTDGAARVWSTVTGELTAVMLGHANAVTGVTFSPDGYSLVTTSRDRTARVWKPDTGALRAVLAGAAGPVTGAAFDRAGDEVVTASDDGTARVWDPRIQPELTPLARLRKPVVAAAVTPAGRVLVAGPERRLALLGAGGRAAALPAPATAVAVSPDGRRIAAAAGGTIVVYDGALRRVVGQMRARAPVGSLAFGPAGELAAGDARGGATVWTADGRVRVRIRPAHRGPAVVALSPDGSLLATGSEDGVARLYDAATGRLEQTLAGHRAAIRSIRFGPRGRLLVTASLDHDARVWNARTGALVHVLIGHFALVSDAAFSPDARWIVTAGPTLAGLWDARTGQLLFFLRGHEGRLVSAVFAPDGRRIVTAGVDGTVRSYRCDVCGGLDELVPLAERRLRAAG